MPERHLQILQSDLVIVGHVPLVTCWPTKDQILDEGFFQGDLQQSSKVRGQMTGSCRVIK